MLATLGLRSMTDVIMPRLSDSMEEGTILKWLKAPGDEVRVGEPLAEIETDKATMTYEADAAGFLEPVAAEGDTLRDRRRDRAAASTRADGAAARAGGAAAAQRRRAAARDGARAAQRSPRGAQAEPAAEPAQERRAGQPAAERRRPRAGGRPPAAAVGASRPRRSRGGSRASWASISRALAGSGPDGRIVKADVVAAPRPATPPAPAPRRARGAATRPARRARSRSIEPNRTQQVIARRMASAKATIPEFQVTVDVDAEAAFELREQLRGQAEPLPSINDLVIKACALALRAHPRVNGAYVDGHFELYGRVNIGMAVASEGSLVVPTIFDADRSR